MPQPLTDAINALTAYANTVTGASDTTLSDAVATLAAGYGGGGGISIDDIASGSQPSGDLVITASVIVANAFYAKNTITSIWAENATRLGNSAIQNGTGIKQVYIGGENSTIGTYAIRGCTSLKSVRFPKFAYNAGFGGYGLQNCSSLELIDFGGIATITLNNMPSAPLHTLILRKSDNLVNLNNGTALDNSTAFKNGGTGGEVYIPKVFYDHLGDGTSQDYKAKANWSNYVGYGTVTFKQIEGSQYEQLDFDYQV